MQATFTALRAIDRWNHRERKAASEPTDDAYWHKFWSKKQPDLRPINSGLFLRVAEETAPAGGAEADRLLGAFECRGRPGTIGRTRQPQTRSGSGLF
jgi:hypothetical protein